jgi:hypothetical protein
MVGGGGREWQCVYVCAEGGGAHGEQGLPDNRQRTSQSTIPPTSRHNSLPRTHMGMFKKGINTATATVEDATDGCKSGDPSSKQNPDPRPQTLNPRPVAAIC